MLTNCVASSLIPVIVEDLYHLLAWILSLLPPYRATLKMHRLRSFCQSLVWHNSRFAYPAIPSPVGCGWKPDTSCDLEVDWVDGDLISSQLFGVLEEQSKERDSDDALDMIKEEVDEDDVFGNIIDVIFDDMTETEPDIP